MSCLTVHRKKQTDQNKRTQEGKRAGGGAGAEVEGEEGGGREEREREERERETDFQRASALRHRESQHHCTQASIIVIKGLIRARIMTVTVAKSDNDNDSDTDRT